MEVEGSFGDWVTRQRKALDLTREQLARRIGCSVSGLRKIERDERRPSRQVAELLADCLQVPPDRRPMFVKAARGVECVERPGPLLPVSAAARSRPTQLRSPLNLPIPPTSLIGREPELASLAQLLRDPRCQLLTLVGSGGIGKTRLALELAAAWVRVLTCREIAQEIERKLDFLVASARDLPERYCSMRAVFNHSWKLISDGERRTLARGQVMTIMWQRF